ncbi:MAG: hypothetical protein H0W63_10620 [Gemmatimonadaceae bacterium]|nr:hypothetical protein [Gemmatimonadaceae bacterium]
MAADGRRSSFQGFALFAAVIVIAVIAVLSTAVLVAFAGDNDRERIERTADVLHRLAAAIDTLGSSTQPAPSFRSDVGKGPGKLSQLVTKILPTTDFNCAGVAYTTTTAGNWVGPYYYAPIPTPGYPIAAGFTANNTLVKVTTTSLAIVIPGVSLADAQSLELVVEGKNSGAGPIMFFSSTNMTSVQYRILSGSTIC